MLKHNHFGEWASVASQPPLGGCVLKHSEWPCNRKQHNQPPLGGCVLKLVRGVVCVAVQAAAFRRLCVETMRLANHCLYFAQPPLGGCVLKLRCDYDLEHKIISRL